VNNEEELLRFGNTYDFVYPKHILQNFGAIHPVEI
jgi:hypothetical protein